MTAPLDPSLHECEVCSAKPGTPTLCATCLENRRAAGARRLGPKTATAATPLDLDTFPICANSTESECDQARINLIAECRRLRAEISVISKERDEWAYSSSRFTVERDIARAEVERLTGELGHLHHAHNLLRESCTAEASNDRLAYAITERDAAIAEVERLRAENSGHLAQCEVLRRSALSTAADMYEAIAERDEALKYRAEARNILDQISGALIDARTVVVDPPQDGVRQLIAERAANIDLSVRDRADLYDARVECEKLRAQVRELETQVTELSEALAGPEFVARAKAAAERIRPVSEEDAKGWAKSECGALAGKASLTGKVSPK